MALDVMRGEELGVRSVGFGFANWAVPCPFFLPLRFPQIPFNECFPGSLGH